MARLRVSSRIPNPVINGVRKNYERRFREDAQVFRSTPVERKQLRAPWHKPPHAGRHERTVGWPDFIAFGRRAAPNPIQRSVIGVHGLATRIRKASRS